ncbi:hypothetical protein ACPPVO_42030 [Dactylosporangium sp. McL0621]|uniref:hypothetical protein n=1 Tax=Dactylosporangium sp. McL0621 TaxID=3415678 RepID=UPI003CF8A63F
MTGLVALGSRLTVAAAPRLALPLRLTVVLALAVSGYVHAERYIHGYEHIAWIGPMFLIQAGGSAALTLLLLAGAWLREPPWLLPAGVALAGGALAGFALSRTVGVFGFVERGWQPAPQAALSVVAEAVVLLTYAVAAARAARPR